jgi:hypothetical protein
MHNVMKSVHTTCYACYLILPFCHAYRLAYIFFLSQNPIECCTNARTALNKWKKTAGAHPCPSLLESPHPRLVPSLQPRRSLRLPPCLGYAPPNPHLGCPPPRLGRRPEQRHGRPQAPRWIAVRSPDLGSLGRSGCPANRHPLIQVAFATELAGRHCERQGSGRSREKYPGWG